MSRHQLTRGGLFALVIAASLSGCGKMKDRVPDDASHLRSTAKRLQASCASTVANQKLKGLLFDEAIARHGGDRTNLDTLADYSTLRMEAPVVMGRDDTLDVTKCAGRLILDIPPGAERGLGGERQLQGDIRYTAQASADGNGFVYQLSGAEPLVARLASFDLTSVAFKPPPAIDQQQPGVAAPPSMAQVQARGSAQIPASGDAVVRAFYGSLRTGDGASAAAHVVPEKRLTGPYSSGAMSRFYGGLEEPIELLGVTPAGAGKYRVRYHYSAGRSSCNGSAIVGVINRDGRDLIRSIRALNGC